MKIKKNVCLVVSLILLAAIAIRAQDAPPPGGIKLLPGYHHQPQQGFDSQVGIISKKDGTEIHYDIGGGDYTGCQWCGWTEGEVWRKQQVINEQKAVLVFTKEKRLVVSFPEIQANFYATIRTEDEMADMLLMLFTFRPTLRKK